MLKLQMSCLCWSAAFACERLTSSDFKFTCEDNCEICASVTVALTFFFLIGAARQNDVCNGGQSNTEADVLNSSESSSATTRHTAAMVIDVDKNEQVANVSLTEEKNETNKDKHHVLSKKNQRSRPDEPPAW